jgi:hypothetical protein
MKKTITIISAALFVLSLGACSLTSEMTIYLVSEKERPDALKKFGCEEYLVPVKIKTMGDVTVEKALNALLDSTDPKKYGEDLETATGFKDRFLLLSSVEGKSVSEDSPIVVSFMKNESVGIAGVCDTPRIQEQVKETIRTAAGNRSFIIRLNESAKNWEKLGDLKGE